MRTITLIICLFVCGCSSLKLEEVPIVDTHIHFFDTSRKEGVMWPPKDNKVLHVPTFPADFEKVANKHNIKAAVVVQASNWVTDADWNLKVTEIDKTLYPSIVCNLSTLGTDQFKVDIDRLRKNPRIVGVRITHPPQDRKFLTPKLMEDLKYMAQVGLSLDILYRRFDFNHVLQIAQEIPELQIMIGIKGLTFKQKSALAKLPNVYSKIVNNYPDKEEGLDFLNEVWDLFSEDRMVFGSNWPGTKLKTNSYQDKKEFLFHFLKNKSDIAVQKVFYRNAMKFYKIKQL